MTLSRLLCVFLCLFLLVLSSHTTSAFTTKLDVVICGGSVAGLSAALTLGRSCRHVLVVDAGLPCNQWQATSYNLLTQDGVPPAALQRQARDDLAAYPTVQLVQGQVVGVRAMEDGGFVVNTTAGETFQAKKIVLATGMKDFLPEKTLKGIQDCWGKTVLHCPYCHGYEFRQQPTGLFLQTAKEVLQMTPILRSLIQEKMTIFGATRLWLQPEQGQKMTQHGVSLVPHDIIELVHNHGILSGVVLETGDVYALEVLYVRPPLVPSNDLHQQLQLEMVDDAYIQVDDHQRTSRPGVYACGDCTTPNRALSVAMGTGTKAGKMLNYELAMDEW